jgi:hypothetical protein
MPEFNPSCISLSEVLLDKANPPYKTGLLFLISDQRRYTDPPTYQSRFCCHSSP